MALSKGQATRQKMINLMYLVFIAMLALNVSTEVLDGFDLIYDNLQKTIDNTTVRNDQIYNELENSYNNNPEKTSEAYNKALSIKTNSDSIFDYIQSLKVEIAKKSDGPNADVNNLKSRDNLDAASTVMLSPTGGQGKILKKAIENYRQDIIAQIPDENKKQVIANTLTTEPSARAAKDKKNWVQASFENMPSIAVLTYLSELQVNIKEAEGEVLNNLLKNIDLKDYRVNQLKAFVVPQSNIVMKGASYKANIILAAVDTTQRPKIIVQGKELPSTKNGEYEIAATTAGLHKFGGFIELSDRSGNVLKHDFSEEYTVIEPMATIAPLLMDVLYTSISNPISISVPGVPNHEVFPTAEGGTLERNGDKWNAKVTASPGQKFIITVTANMNGNRTVVARKDFRIRALPDPTPYIEYTDDKGTLKRFKRGALTKSILLNADGLKASIDDGILDVPFTVISFRTMSPDAMGNITPELSNGANFSERQKDQIRKLNRGKFLFISGIKVKEPNGAGEREINGFEIRVN